MTRHWHPIFERIVRWLTPSAESFASAGALYGPDLTLQVAAMRALEGEASAAADVTKREPHTLCADESCWPITRKAN